MTVAQIGVVGLDGQIELDALRFYGPPEDEPHGQHPARRGQSTLLCRLGGPTPGSVTQLRQLPADPGRFSSVVGLRAPRPTAVSLQRRRVVHSVTTRRLPPNSSARSRRHSASSTPVHIYALRKFQKIGKPVTRSRSVRLMAVER
mgnify:CR=1 FL=1